MIAGGIAAPLQALVAAMRRVLAGDFGQRLHVRREDEIGFLAGSFNEMVAGLEERETIKETFGRFVSRDVATAVLSGQLPLDGERREVTILFQDVRGFTTMAEHTEPPRPGAHRQPPVHRDGGGGRGAGRHHPPVSPATG